MPLYQPLPAQAKEKAPDNMAGPFMPGKLQRYSTP